MTKQRGFGLLALWISLALASLLALSMLHFYATCIRYFMNIEHDVASMMDVESVYLLLQRNIKNAGFTPCMNINKLQTWDYEHPGSPVRAVIVRNDHLITGHMDLDAVSNQRMMISDCFHAEIFKSNPLNSPVLHFHYEEPSYVGVWEEDDVFSISSGFYLKHRQHQERLSSLITKFNVISEYRLGEEWIVSTLVFSGKNQVSFATKIYT